jgi:hypothetical protein
MEDKGRKPMRVLVACEYSGTVRDAFIKRGHDALSCDLLPTDVPGPHYQESVLDILGDGWDLMVAHPPCTHLAVSGARHFAAKRADGRQQQGIDFFMALVNAPIKRIAVENPVCIMSRLYRKPDQIIQPYEFGHPESKKTCLWLKGLPPLMATKILNPVGHKNPYGSDYKDAKGKRYSEAHYNPPRWANQTPSGQNKLGPSPDRWKIRSKTYQGIADAMAEQWGGLP